MTTLVQICEALGALLGGAGVFYSRRAARLSEPTGDGFASAVFVRFDKIDNNINDLKGRVRVLETQPDRPGPGQQEPARG